MVSTPLSICSARANRAFHRHSPFGDAFGDAELVASSVERGYNTNIKGHLSSPSPLDAGPRHRRQPLVRRLLQPRRRHLNRSPADLTNPSTFSIAGRLERRRRGLPSIVARLLHRRKNRDRRPRRTRPPRPPHSPVSSRSPYVDSRMLTASPLCSSSSPLQGCSSSRRSRQMSRVGA
ncbi:hypothetical protein DFP72DRAFT_637741 [Ephemerocybe angulata]|uniref:Uncharacterized protein n=1 Tax=Ephemerocybe angulata TaxID=980116 RepID=A0A8H6LXZ1_9AGAR|nr:hypothetical protein DFP72DRAFT_637741 [Tulosesus angulatus]